MAKKKKKNPDEYATKCTKSKTGNEFVHLFIYNMRQFDDLTSYLVVTENRNVNLCHNS